MDTYTDIEIICTGNNGRSPVGLAAMSTQDFATSPTTIAKHYICSSGTQMDLSNIANLAEAIKPFVEKSIRNGAPLGDNVLERLKENPEEIAALIISTEAKWRNRYIQESMGQDYSEFERRQTIVRPEAQLILPVDTSNLKKVEAIYSSFKGKGPRIQTLTDFAGINYDLTQHGLARNYADYARHAAKVEIAARAAFLKAAGIN